MSFRSISAHFKIRLIFRQVAIKYNYALKLYLLYIDYILNSHLKQQNNEIDFVLKLQNEII